MPKRAFIDRLTDSVMSFRDPLPMKSLNLEIKSATERPNFGRSSSWGDQYVFPGQWNYPNRNYRSEVGDLHNASLVMAIVNYTGVSLAEALPVILKPDQKGILQIEPQHEVSDLIRRPNPFHIWADYCQAGAFDWWMGNWYLKMVRDGTGKVIELWWIPQFLIEPRWPYDGKSPEVPLPEVEGDPSQSFISHYQYSIPGKVPELIPRSEMVHIKRGVSSMNARKGEGVWDAVLEEVYGDNAVGRFSATIMRNMGMVRMLLSPKDKDVTIDPVAAQNIKQQFIVGSTGDNANTPLVNPLSLDVTQLSFNPKELDLKELRNVPESRVAGVTGIPAIVLQFLVGLEHGHYGAAYEQAREQGYENVIIPIQKHIAEDFTWQLLPEMDKTKGARVDFDLTKVRVLQEDRDSLYKRESEALRAGAITINQFLTSVGKDTMPDGDIYLVPSLATPMTVEKLKERAESDVIITPLSTDPASLAKFAEMERMFEGLEGQMKGFVNESSNA